MPGSHMGDAKVALSRSMVLCVIAAILMSMVMVLERHYSLVEARRDHQAMQRRLEALAAKLDLPSDELASGTEASGGGRGGAEGEGRRCRQCKMELAECDARGTDKGGSEGTREEVKLLKRELEKLQTSYDKQTEEKLRMAQMMTECETSSEWTDKTMTPKAVEAAKAAIAKCGEAFQGTGKGGAATAAAKLYSCEATEEELARYLNYTARADCPDDWHFVQNLIFVKYCFSLPKRTCFSRSPSSYTEPVPFPQSLWDLESLKDENVRWDLHSYKSFNALNTRKLGDCKNCFNLTLEETRWKRRRHGTLPLDEVVKMKAGALRIGLDAGGGTGSFAAKMAAYNCTILTTAMNIETLWDNDGGLPYMETIALRGLVPLHLPHKARLPFFDNTLDIIHTVNSIKYFTLAEFEELIFDWDRVLRPGGIIWLEWFYTPVSEMPLYVAILDLFHFNKLYWNMSPKTDSGERKGEHVYLNCVLEKPHRKQ